MTGLASLSGFSHQINPDTDTYRERSTSGEWTDIGDTNILYRPPLMATIPMRSTHRSRTASLIAWSLTFGTILMVVTRSAGAQPLVSEIWGGTQLNENTYFWLQHIDGRQLGDVSPYTSLGGSHYRFMNNGVLLFETQALVTNDGGGGATIGGNRRFWLDDDTIAGAGLWFDVNQSRRENTFQQGAVSLELLRDDWSLRANGYLPMGPRVRHVSNLGAVPDPNNRLFPRQLSVCRRNGRTLGRSRDERS